MSRSDRIQPDVTIDATGMSCPGPVLEAKRRADELDRGAVLLLISDCPGTQSDLEAWARQSGREVLESESLEGRGRAFYIRNGDPWLAASVLDMRGRPCPAPVIEAEKRLNDLGDGDVLKLLSDCRGFSDDLDTWARNTGHRVLGTLPGPAGSDVAFIQD
jgi:TusA-related sulfurtransferase